MKESNETSDTPDLTDSNGKKPSLGPSTNIKKHVRTDFRQNEHAIYVPKPLFLDPEWDHIRDDYGDTVDE